MGEVRYMLEALRDDTGERQEWFVGKTCPQCKLGKWRKPKSHQWSYVICDRCDAIQMMYLPMPHQDEFHRHNARYKFFAGGYGSGKTRTGAEETALHVIHTPAGMTLVGAQTIPQLEETAQDMFFKVFPQDLIKEWNKTKRRLLTKTNHVVLFRPLDDAGKIKSLNLTAFWIEEASEVKYDIFVQLQTRLRNKIARHRQGIITSNPDLNWIKTEFLLKSEGIFNAEVNYYQDEAEVNPAFATFIAPTHLNYHLPDDYIEVTAKGKPDWWIQRFLKGSFEHSEGLVYPNGQQNLIDPFPIPKHWPRIISADFGQRDPTVFNFYAIDPRKGIIYQYDEHHAVQKTVEYHAKEFHKKVKEIPVGRIQWMPADPKGAAKDIKDMRSLFDWYAEYDIHWEKGINKIKDGIAKVYGYLERDRLKIFRNCVETIKELVDYKYKPQVLGDDKNPSEEPIDFNNHHMDALKYAIAEMPDDPDDLVNPSAPAYDYGKKSDQEHLPHALRTDDQMDYSTDWAQYYDWRDLL